ncbi:hypothetical protein [Aliagarivorans taiwanensis]|uniref:hypothetical protein n=1 Tax=Aliagarivorans taiwanensis TaxID=561966 RepID=UPI0012F73D5F|nr:hypothetical protein [Aliagarivorans taiwanensis]
MTSEQQLWERFVAKESYQGLMVPANFNSPEHYHQRPEAPELSSYKEVMKLLRPLMLQKAHRTLGSRYRNFRSKSQLNKRTITIKEGTWQAVVATKLHLGFDGTTENGIDAALEYIIDSKSWSLSEQLSDVDALRSGNPHLSHNERLALLLSNATPAVREGVFLLLAEAYKQGWKKAINTRCSSAKVDSRLEQDLKTAGILNNDYVWVCDN